MPQRSVQARLDDMITAIDGIRMTLENVEFETYVSAWHLQRATERGLEIISEASRSIPAELKALRPDIPWQQIAAIGNQLRHAYERIDPLIIWNIVEQNLETALRLLADHLGDQRGTIS